MKRKQFLICTLTAAMALTAASCGSKASKEKEDTTQTAVEGVEEVVAVSDPVYAIFSDSSKASEVATDSTYATTPSGLKYLVIKEGEGNSPAATDVVEVNYEGKFIDGSVFDSSYERGEPTSFPLNQVIAGWTEGLQLMKEGGKTIFYIPSDLAYGPNGIPGAIPPNADLIFTVELLTVQK